MPATIGRRELITGLAGAAVGWPVTAPAQQPMPVIGVVRMAKRGESTHVEDAFRQGLKQVSYVENQNVVIEWRWAEGRYERLSGILAELVDRRVAAIAVPGATEMALAAKAATQTIPIVFLMGGDHRICPACYQSGKKGFLQSRGPNAYRQEIVQCSECNKQFELGNRVERNLNARA